MKLDYLNNRNLQLQLEKLIIGVEEPIFITGIGEVLAKVDSGNSAYNVLHGEDFYYQGDTVVFTTVDTDGNEKKVSKKVQDYITINIGGGHTEKRPIVLFKVKFAGETYLNVPFSIGNRASNVNKCLLGKDFLIKKLDALIDVSKHNIADKDINVDVPITEDVNSGDSNTWNAMKRGGIGGHITPNNYQYFNKNTNAGYNPSANNPSGSTSTAGKVGRFLKGGFKAWQALSNNTGNNTIVGWIRSAVDAFNAEIEKIQLSDKQLIFRALNEYFAQNKIPISEQVIDPQVYKVLDYAGNTYAQESLVKQKKQSVNSESVKLSAFMQRILTEDQPQPTTSITSANNTSNTPPNNGNPSAANNNQPSQDNNKPKATNNDAEWEKARKFVNDKNKYIYYFVLFDGRKKDAMTALLNQKYPEVKSGLTNIFNHMQENFGNPNAQVDGIMKDITKACKEQGIMGMFAYCVGSGAARRAHVITNNIYEEFNGKFLGASVARYIQFLVYGLEDRFGLNLDNEAGYPQAVKKVRDSKKKYNSKTGDLMNPNDLPKLRDIYFSDNFNNNKWFGFNVIKRSNVLSDNNNNDRIKSWAERSLDLAHAPINIELAMYAYENDIPDLGSIDPQILDKSKKKMQKLISEYPKPRAIPASGDGKTPTDAGGDGKTPADAGDPSKARDATPVVKKLPNTPPDINGLNTTIEEVNETFDWINNAINNNDTLDSAKKENLTAEYNKLKEQFDKDLTDYNGIKDTIDIKNLTDNQSALINDTINKVKNLKQSVDELKNKLNSAIFVWVNAADKKSESQAKDNEAQDPEVQDNSAIVNELKRNINDQLKKLTDIVINNQLNGIPNEKANKINSDLIQLRDSLSKPNNINKEDIQNKITEIAGKIDEITKSGKNQTDNSKVNDNTGSEDKPVDDPGDDPGPEGWTFVGNKGKNKKIWTDEKGKYMYGYYNKDLNEWKYKSCDKTGRVKKINFDE